MGAYWCLGRAQCMIWVYFTVHRDAHYRGGQNFHVFSFLLKWKVYSVLTYAQVKLSLNYV